jgi:gliding motility-associated-like protein
VTSTEDYCNSSNGTATAVVSGGTIPYSYLWDTNPAQTTDIVTGLSSGQYNVIVTDANGCSVTGSTTVLATAAFSLATSSEVEHCSHADGTATVTASNALYPLTYSWSHNTSLNSSTASNLAAGTYTITVSDGSCSIATSVIVGSYSGPTAGFHPDRTVSGLDDGSIEFNDMSSGATMYLYDFGDGSTSTQQSPEHQYNNSGTYSVMQVVSDEFGCMDTTYVDILINEGFAFFVPSAFSPNGDGKNDYFVVYGYGIDLNTFNMAIFDRWGEKVFQTTDINKMWDGGRSDAKDPKDVRQAIYSYHITFKTMAGKDKEYFGRVVTLP